MDFKQLLNTFPVIPLFSLFALQSTTQERSPHDLFVKETIELRQQHNYWKSLNPFRSYIKDTVQNMINAFIPFTASSLKSIKLDKRRCLFGLGAVQSKRQKTKV